MVTQDYTRLHKIVFSLVTEKVLVGFNPILCFRFHPLLVTQSHDRASSALYSGLNLFVKWTQNLCVCIPTATRCRSWQWEYKYTRSVPISRTDLDRNTKPNSRGHATVSLIVGGNKDTKWD